MLEVLMGCSTFGLISGIPAGEQQGAQKHQNGGEGEEAKTKPNTKHACEPPTNPTVFTLIMQL